MFKRIVTVLLAANMLLSPTAYSFAQGGSEVSAEDIALLVSSLEKDETSYSPKAVGVASAVGGLAIIYSLRRWTDAMEKQGYKYARSAGKEELNYMLKRGYGGLNKKVITSLDFKLSEIIREYIQIKFSGLKLSPAQTNALMDDIFQTFQKKGINLFTHPEMFEGRVVQSYSFMVPEVVETRANIFAKQKFQCGLYSRKVKAGIAGLAVFAVSAVIYFSLPKDNDAAPINNVRAPLQRAIYKIKAEDPNLLTLYLLSLPAEVKKVAYTIVAENDELAALVKKQISEVNSLEFKEFYQAFLKAEAQENDACEKIDMLKTDLEKVKEEGYKGIKSFDQNMFK